MTDDPLTFAQTWIAAWNSHDLERILAHYAEDIVFASPVAARMVGTGRIEGKAALRRYWAQALAHYPDLRFELDRVFVGHQALTITYQGVGGRWVAETLEFGADGQVVRAYAAYAEPSPPT